MSELRKIVVCKAPECQNKGSKQIKQLLVDLYTNQYTERYPKLLIDDGVCQGDCERGPIVYVNDTVWLSEVDKETAQQLLEEPESLLGDVMHVLEKDRDTFERIISGEDIY